ncbi:NAD(P)-dependent oxidoreductase [Vibrio lentus]
MKIGITGCNGVLGNSLLAYTSSKGFKGINISRENIHFSNSLVSLKSYLSSLNLDVLIHCAANTNVESCEREPQQCYQDNYLLTERLAIICNVLKIKLVFISSTGIYGEASSQPYQEFHDTKPTTVHHHSKLLAEQSLRNLTKDYLIIRTGWIFGGDWNKPKNFVANRIKEALLSRGTIQSDSEQYGSPTYVEDLSSCILELIVQGYSGIYNCVNDGACNRFTYVSKIIEYSKLVGCSVQPIGSSSFNRLARVSKNESAINFKLNSLGIINMPFWEVSLKKYIDSIAEYY